ncbi:hypothetical protein KRR38_30120 [Novosphingobium sp. G106]|uniref:hypothetical protein n=1 Tax=Novosphingobium sp. G106 TaxID=2849500 RepID=UPI001C2CEF1D|nr:hypothetical protein [Novosphingobium sp. G106]MBV1691820.1 hypothetical protein [Novosphingobium sp. G106]
MTPYVQGMVCSRPLFELCLQGPPHRYVPPLTHKTRNQVTPGRTYRLSVNAIGELLDYSVRGARNYAGHADRLLPFRRYLSAAICTLARPDAIYDMNVDRNREQWMQNERMFALNPAGRIQTKKFRPIGGCRSPAFLAFVDG